MILDADHLLMRALPSIRPSLVQVQEARHNRLPAPRAVLAGVESFGLEGVRDVAGDANSLRLRAARTQRAEHFGAAYAILPAIEGDWPQLRVAWWRLRDQRVQSITAWALYTARNWS